MSQPRVVIGVDIGIRGVGDRRAVLDARGAARVLAVPEGSVVTLRHLVVTGGRVEGKAGGIRTTGALTLTDSMVRDNAAGTGAVSTTSGT